MARRAMTREGVARTERSGRCGDGGERAQTMLDFAVAAGIFLFAISVVIAFVPGMLTPFAGAQDEIQLADRLASHLATDVLGSPAEPYVLDESCTREFFDEDGSDGTSGCRFDDDGGDLNTALHVEERRSLNVSIRNDSGVVDTASGRLEVGDITPSNAENVVVAQRVVSYAGDTYRLVVRVW